MAEEKKRPSIAEILAAARKDGNKASEEAAAPAAKAAPVQPVAEAAEAPAEVDGPAPTPKPAAPKAAAKPATAGSGKGGKMSVAEMMAAARAEKGNGGPSTAPKPAAAKAAPVEKTVAKPAAAKPAAAKPAAAEKTAPAAPKQTASILAAARTADKPGPMTKAEAAAKPQPSKAPAAAAKAKLTVPPMPVKPAYAVPKPAKPKAAEDEDRRGFVGLLFGSFLGIGFTALSVTSGLWTLGTARFMFPNILTEPPSRFKVGPKDNVSPGQVETKYVASNGVWVVNTQFKGQQIIFALKTVCTHLGCTPNWLEGEQKFKCPCHGSGFYKDGVNFEGPAPRPLERYAIKIGDDGQLEVDKSKTFHEELGQWTDPTSFVVA